MPAGARARAAPGRTSGERAGPWRAAGARVPAGSSYRPRWQTQAMASKAGDIRAGEPEGWDWSRKVVDHLDLHASDFAESVRFYQTVLRPLGIPKLFEREDEACFTHVNV